MSLAGSLDEFALADVVSLLAATSARGTLHLATPTHAVEVTVRGEHLVEPPGTALVDVVDRLLWEGNARFRWEPGPADQEGSLVAAAPVVAAAARRQAERAEMASIVPSGEWRVSLGDGPSLPVVLDVDAWEVVRAVGGGRAMGALVAGLGREPLLVHRTVQGLLDQGLLRLSEPPAAATPPVAGASGEVSGAATPPVAGASGEVSPAGRLPLTRSLFAAVASERPAPTPPAPTPPTARPAPLHSPSTGTEAALADRGPWPAGELESLLAEARNEESGWRADQSGRRDGPRQAGRPARRRLFSTAKA